MRIHEDKDMKDIQKVIDKKFIGKILQTPPIKSRVKRQEREREIKKFELLEQEGKDIVFRADVEGGTYIRKLISDLGDEMKIGAHMLELRRVRAGIFKEDNAVDLYEFEKAVKEYESGNDKPLKEMIIPAEIVSEVYKPIQIKKTSMSRIFHGSPIHNGDLEKPVKIKTGKTISIFSGNRFIGMFKVLNTKNIFAKSKFVLQPLKGESK
jgi:H/ACA ribonucleoprotein complex subunit 4